MKDYVLFLLILIFLVLSMLLISREELSIYHSIVTKKSYYYINGETEIDFVSINNISRSDTSSSTDEVIPVGVNTSTSSKEVSSSSTKNISKNTPGNLQTKGNITPVSFSEEVSSSSSKNLSKYTTGKLQTKGKIAVPPSSKKVSSSSSKNISKYTTRNLQTKETITPTSSSKEISSSSSKNVSKYTAEKLQTKGNIIPVTSSKVVSSSSSKNGFKYTAGNLPTKNITSKEPPKKFILDRNLCINKNERSADVPSEWKNKCPDKPIVTTSQGGRLGNQIWEYASVWLVAKISNREPFIPSCFINKLQKMFKNFTRIPPLKYIEECPINYTRLVDSTDRNIFKTNGSIILREGVQLYAHIAPYMKEVVKLFQFHDYITEKSQGILRNASKGITEPVFVGVHVRRTDYKHYMKVKHNMSLLTEDFYIRHMDYFRFKYPNSVFIVTTDDPGWCEKKLNSSDTLISRGNSPEQDLSLLANCNHTIYDYGTFGTWGAFLAGGETLSLKWTARKDFIRFMPHWHLVT